MGYSPCKMADFIKRLTSLIFDFFLEGLFARDNSNVPVESFLASF